MTPFTDENLQRLKKCIPVKDVAGGLTISFQEWKALLARLEAAEAFGEMMSLTYGKDADETILYEAWRKAAGK